MYIEGGTLIDGLGGPPRPNPGLAIDGEVISHLGEREVDGLPVKEDPSGREVIDATGAFITPGLIDGHCHLSLHQGALGTVKYPTSAEFSTLWAARCAAQTLHAGVTSISVPGGKWFVDVTVRDCINAGLLEGPRIFTAAQGLTPYGGIFDTEPTWEDQTHDDSAGIVCNSPDEFRREIRRQAKGGVDLIKLADDFWGDTQGISMEELTAAVDEARRHNLRVAIHSRGSGSTRAAALAGVDWIFHADLATDEDLDVVAEKQVPIMPAFTAVYLAVEQGGPARLGEQLKINLETIRKAFRKGIEILVGTDTGNAAAFGHGRYHGWEAGILVNEIGLSPMEALVANTRLNAKVVGLDGKVGTLEPGKLADVVIWNRNPLDDISVLRRPEEIRTVIKGGSVVDRKHEGFRPLPEEPKRSVRR